MNQDSKRQITLEDILRLKRAERPPSEFWQQFDRELRAKQLSALVEKRPWWRNLPRSFPRFARYQLPLGGAALLTVTFFATRSYHPSMVAPSEASKLVVQSQSAPSQAVDVSVSKSTAPQFTRSEVVTPTAIPTVSPAVAALAEPTTGTELAASNPVSREFVSPGEARILPEEDSLAAHAIAASLSAVQASIPTVSRGLLTSTNGFESRALSARARVVEPLAQMRNPADASRARLQSAMAASFANESPARVNERIAHRLSDDRLRDDGVSRINAKGNSVAFSF